MLNSLISIIKREKTVLANSGYNLLANIAGSAIGLTTNFILSLILGPSGFGTFKTITAFFENLPVTLGLNTTLTKYIPELETQGNLGKIKYLLKSFFTVRIGIILVFLVPLYVLREKIASGFLKDPSNLALMHMGMILFAVNSLDLVRPCVLGFRNYKLYIITNFLISALRNISALVCAYLWGLPAAIIALAFSFIPGIIPSINYLSKKGLFSAQPVRINSWQIIKNYSLPVYFVGLTGLAGGLNTPLLALFYPQKIIGYYSFALIIGSLIALISGAIGQIFFTEVALEHYKNGVGASFKRLKRVLILFSLACAITIPIGIAASGPLIHYLAPTYIPAIPIVTPLLFIYSIIGTLSLITSYYTAISKNKIAAGTNLLSSIILFSLSFLTLKLI
ncbi:oligosaccharide flippase family protein [Patescibacteria group bacterium]|nr:oligosaccharide flippase family protein [Patescibacteria group bacterium]